ncbi:MAG: glycerol-3-phosphate dehydrogenase subunit GlpB [Propionibacterium sp.]|mgnify:CR=1 FL=1|nr:glycerol-3-phosphate dehydrogenase subunit GlpB [Propionibacterium sp.]NLI84716.1 glycerol-3-phosphate dehydrogenase subunit GlpB [Propionibacterium sp.]
MNDVVVVGGGIAGLLSAARLVAQGAKVTLVTFGVGGLQLSHGGFDVLGYAPERVDRPFDVLDDFIAANPEHPYAVLGADAVRLGTDFASEFFGERLVGNDGRNWLLPTAVGALRPTYLASPTMVNAEARAGHDPVVVVGLQQLKDFQAELIAGNLVKQQIPARAIVLDLPARTHEADASGLTYARAMDRADYRADFAKALGKQLLSGEKALIPAIAGHHEAAAFTDLQTRLGAPLAEIPLPPPGVPGMRLNEYASRRLQDQRVRWILGARVVALHSEGGRAVSVDVATSGHLTKVRADAVVYAPGGFESGSLSLDSHGKVLETHLGLPVRVPPGRLIGPDRRSEQPLFRSGLAVDDQMRVLDDADRPVYPNLFAAGGVLAGAMRWSEKSGEGIAAASAVRAADAIGDLA